MTSSRSLLLYDTLRGATAPFSPQHVHNVTLYSCGPTVYNHVHIGNLRSYVFADVLKRTLIAHGYSVRHTINLTDFGHLTDDADNGEDKMTLAVKRAGLPFTLASMKQVASVYTASFQADCVALNILPPTTYAAASDYIDEQVALICRLREFGHTYEISDGIYFNISTFPTYGKLGNIDLSTLESGARVAVNIEKKHPADFCVWKHSPHGFDTMLGTGFPGWHIECSAMAQATLGEQIDIHTGGIDHIHTHHNGEIAQSEAGSQKTPFSRWWMHNAFITIDETKISKSLGNEILLKTVIERGYHPLVYRYWLLMGHYRSPMNFTFDALDASAQALERLWRRVYTLVESLPHTATQQGVLYAEEYDAFMRAMDADLNTAAALSVMWDMIRTQANKPERLYTTLVKMDDILGLGLVRAQHELERDLGLVPDRDISDTLRVLLHERDTARAQKDFVNADQKRSAIEAFGYTILDTSHGSRLVKVKKG
jgi:cysteinyl-tRNA synthetase